MPLLLKDLYSPAFYNRLSEVLEELVPNFNRDIFLDQIFTDNFVKMELRERMRHTSRVLKQFFPDDFSHCVELILSIIERLRELGVKGGIEFMFLPDFIELYGIEHPDESLGAFEHITQFISCEFAVRPFLIRYESKTVEQMKNWSLHQNHHVRRLASEGSRPRLPWAMAVPALKKDPSAILYILENLKNDPSEYVRRSVANSLNDISKDHTDLVLQIAKKWKGQSKDTDALLKHGLRTLLKAGNAEVLQLYGLDLQNLMLENFKLLSPTVKSGGILQFSFTIRNQQERSQTARIEYALYFKRQRDVYSKKVFKLSERTLDPGEQITFVRKHSFRPITTRRYYPGEQRLSIIINGSESAIQNFELLID